MLDFFHFICNSCRLDYKALITNVKIANNFFNCFLQNFCNFAFVCIRAVFLTLACLVYGKIFIVLIVIKLNTFYIFYKTFLNFPISKYMWEKAVTAIDARVLLLPNRKLAYYFNIKQR